MKRWNELTLEEKVEIARHNVVFLQARMDAVALIFTGIIAAMMAHFGSVWVPYVLTGLFLPLGGWRILTASRTCKRAVEAIRGKQPSLADKITDKAVDKLYGLKSQPQSDASVTTSSRAPGGLAGQLPVDEKKTPPPKSEKAEPLDERFKALRCSQAVLHKFKNLQPSTICEWCRKTVAEISAAEAKKREKEGAAKKERKP